jgi:hydroxymethylpyrimidine kinase/phosphomethylpyrimidine kinase
MSKKSQISKLPVPSVGGLSIYLAQIKKFPMLDAEEEYMLAKNWRENGNLKAAHKLVTSHLRLVAKGGAKLINNAAIIYIKNQLMKNVLLITPNIPEAEILTSTKINSTKDMIKAGKILISLGAKNVLIKGGHLNSKQINDILLNKNITKVFRSKKHSSKNTHGTGCTLSSAIATYLSCGKDLIKSCELGIKYVNEAIKSNLNLGKGNGPINHLNSININKKFK